VCTAPKLGGAYITNSAFKNSDYGVITVRPNAFSAAAGGSGATVQPIAKPAGKTYVVKIESHVEEAAAETRLEEAAVIVKRRTCLGRRGAVDSAQAARRSHSAAQSARARVADPPGCR